jgi:hypothetical protein
MAHFGVLPWLSLMMLPSAKHVICLEVCRALFWQAEETLSFLSTSFDCEFTIYCFATGIDKLVTIYSELHNCRSRLFAFDASKFQSTKKTKLKTKLHGLSPQAKYTDRLSDRRLSAKLVPTLADRGCHVVSATIPPQSLISVF